MMTKRFSRAILFSICLFLLLCSFGGMASSAAEGTRVTVIVDCGDRDGAAVSAAVGALDPTAEILYVYRSVMNGFAARVSEKALTALSALGAEGIYESLSRPGAALSVTEDSDPACPVSYASNRSDLRGAGQAVAVIDTGFDLDAPVFSCDPAGEVRYDRADIERYLDRGLNVSNHFAYFDGESPYRSAKIPFAYDYSEADCDLSGGDHGTHVAARIAGDRRGDPENGFDGAAPDAQLLLMKVGSGADGTVEDHAILAALDDAVTLDVDVINLSFGVPAGFSATSLCTVSYTKYLDVARARGIDVVSAAGNEGRLGAGSTYEAACGIDRPLVTMPDSGLINEPASFASVLAVGAAEDDKIAVREVLMIGGQPIPFRSAPGADFGQAFDGRTLSYVMIPGVGEASDYENRNVRGRVAVIGRGTLPFAEKIAIACDRGAVGVIVYNDDPDETDLLYMQTDPERAIPAAFVSAAGGAILGGSDPKELSVECGPLRLVERDRAASVAAYSAWGVAPDLTIKPDVTAVGSDVWSAQSGGRYGAMSGTSMAAPYVSGALLALRGAGDPTEARYRLCSTALPLADEDGVAFSPRRQGCGLCDLDRAGEAQVILREAVTGAVTLSGGEIPKNGVMTLTFLCENMTDRPLDVVLSATCAGDGWRHDPESGLDVLTDRDEPFPAVSVKRSGDRTELNRYADAYDGGLVLTLPARGLESVTVTVTPDRAFRQAREKVFSEGFFIEGYLELFASDGSRLAGIPYLGFAGDWGGVSAFGEGDAASFYRRGIVTSAADGTRFFAGDNLYDDTDAVTGPIVLSPNGDGVADTLSLLLRPLRNLRTATVTVTDENGETVTEAIAGRTFQKTYYQPRTGGLADRYVSDVWDAVDFNNRRYRWPDGRYRVTVRGWPDVKNAAPSTVSFEVILDTEKPTVSAFTIGPSGGGYAVSARAADDRAVAAIRFYTADGKTDQTVACDGRRGSVTASAVVNVRPGTHVYLDVTDYAGNVTTDRVTAPPSDSFR